MVEAYFVSCGMLRILATQRSALRFLVNDRPPLNTFANSVPATTVNTSRSLANKPHDPSVRWRIKQALKYPAVTLTPEQIQLVGEGFTRVVALESTRVCDPRLRHHARSRALVIQPFSYEIEKLVILLKGGASDVLGKNDMHPQQRFIGNDGKLPKMWEKGSWNVYLTGAEMIRDKRSDYTNRGNPTRGTVCWHRIGIL